MKFVGYEYKEIIADSNKASFLIDGYECFGWELDDRLQQNGAYGGIHSRYHKNVVGMKRDRKIVNKMELTRLQRNFEACVKEIDMLEKSKTSKGTMYALIIGLIGTAFMAGSVFAIVAETPMIGLCILFAVPAFIGWILPYFIYKRTVKKQTEKINQLIEEKYDEIYEICEKGNKLLHRFMDAESK